MLLASNISKMSEIDETEMDTEELPVVNETEDESGAEDNDGGNEGWADVMDKILKIGTGPQDPLKAKKLRRKSMILLKAKTDTELAAKHLNKKEEEFEIVKEGTDGDKTVKKEVKLPEELTFRQMKKKFKEKRLQKSEWENRSRMKPDVTQKQKEKTLQRMATTGVVQLFNAIKQRQITVETKFKEVGGSEVKKEKVLKGLTKQDFLERLKTPCTRLENTKDENKSLEKTSKPKSKPVLIAPAPTEDAKPAWSALRDDFMLGAEMKDWDKESDSDDEPDDI